MFVCLFTAASAAYGSSQARGQMEPTACGALGLRSRVVTAEAQVAAVAQVQSLAQELPHVAGMATGKKKKKQEEPLVKQSRWTTNIHFHFLLKTPMNDSEGIRMYRSTRQREKRDANYIVERPVQIFLFSFFFFFSFFAF